MQVSIRYYAPQPRLRSMVNGYMIGYLQQDEGAPAFQIPFPAFPQQYLFFFPLDKLYISKVNGIITPTPKELIIGPYTERVNLALAGQQLTLRVDLKPGALHRLAHLPLHEIRNVTFDGVDAFGTEIRQVNEQINRTMTHPQMLHIIESFLLRKAAVAKAAIPIDKVFQQVLISPGKYTIDQLASQSCRSLRQFERQFLGRMGMSPKLFIRQSRFAQAYQLKQMHPQITWSTISYHCGYFDQMHLIRDFKQFAGESPFTYFKHLTSTSIRHHSEISTSLQLSDYEQSD